MGPLEALTADDDSLRESDPLWDAASGPEELAMDSSLRAQIRTLLGDLSPKQAQVLQKRFGLFDDNSFTLEEVGQTFGLTRERIRQIEVKALRYLQTPERIRQLAEYRYVFRRGPRQ